MQFSFAQEKTVTGVVTDKLGPLPGANVVVKGTTNGVQTDFDGKYSIKAKSGDVLEVSFTGYDKKTVSVGASNSYNVVLVESPTALQEVVVVAYGTQKREAITGAVNVVSSEVIGNQQVTSPLKALQGVVPGVSMVTAGGQPGNNPDIRIRGFSSLLANPGPLIILDGAPFNGNLNSISQDQIESFSVLKDAASSTLYGSRGANGVILITTKKGKKNTAPKINLRSQVGFSDLAVGLHDRLGTEANMKLTWEALRNSNIDLGQDIATASANASAGLIDRLGYNPYSVANPIDANGQLVSGASLLWETDWQKEMLRKTATRLNHGFDISGGDDKSTYFMSLDYLKEDGPVITSDIERITTRLGVESQVKDWLKVGLSTSYSYSESNQPDQTSGSTTQSIGWIYALSSIYPLYQRDATGNLVLDAAGNPIYDYGNTVGQSVNATRPVNGGENAIGNIYNGKERIRRTNFNGSLFAEAKLTDFLTFKTRFNYESILFDSFSFDDDLFGAAAPVGGRVSMARNLTSTVNAINGLHFVKSFGNHNLSADLMHEAYTLRGDNLNAQGTGFLPGVTNLNGSTLPESVGGNPFMHRIQSYLGRLNYNYKNKYFVEFSGRRDGSTRWAPETRWGSFYSAGGSWILSREKFLEDSKYISNLKIRASYGELGNEDLAGQYFLYQSTWVTGWNNEGEPGILLDGLYDYNVTWEKTASTNIGLDFGFFNDRITGSFDYYNKRSIDLLLNKPLPGSVGFGQVEATNVGAIDNSGIELVISTINIQKENLFWKTSFNVSQNRNEIKSLTRPGETILRGSQQWEVGRSLYEFFIPEWAGVDPADGRAMWFRDVTDVDGNVIGRETTKVYSQATRGYHGSSLAKFEGGFSSYVKYHNFDLNLIFNYSVGGQLLDTDYSSLMNGFSSPGSNAHPDNITRWQNPGDITDVPRLTVDNNDDNSTSTRFLFDNDYLRLKSLTFGYNLPSDYLKKIGLDNVRFFVQADNVFTFQSHKGIDPEQAFNGVTNRRSPQYRTISTGVTVSF
jgi:TonB-linked SusC/RagA family outer membrane protein